MRKPWRMHWGGYRHLHTITYLKKGIRHRCDWLRRFKRSISASQFPSTNEQVLLCEKPLEPKIPITTKQAPMQRFAKPSADLALLHRSSACGHEGRNLVGAASLSAPLSLLALYHFLCILWKESSIPFETFLEPDYERNRNI